MTRVIETRFLPWKPDFWFALEETRFPKQKPGFQLLSEVIVMTRLMPFVTVMLAAVVGCSQAPPVADTGGKEQPAQAGAGDQAQLDAYVLADKPASPISVRDARARKEGEKVVVTGRVPPEKVKPYNAALATFVMLAPEDMDRPEVKEEFECDDAATCPTCKKLLDDLGVQVELVDQSGGPVGASLEGYRGLKPGSVITVEGEVKRYGKDKKLVRIVATRFYPG
jgi:hypothetical protein